MLSKITYIQELKQKQIEYHKTKHKEKYPNGVFSLQIRYGKYGHDKKDEAKQRSIQLRWGTKSSPQYYSCESFTVEQIGSEIKVIKYISNSFEYTYNFSDVENLLRRCDKEHVDTDIVDVYIRELKNRNVLI